MRVLLTNDDGVGAAGIEALRKELARDHEVCTVAPDRERSGTSHATTFRDEVAFRGLADDLFSCTGTPADCVLFSLLGAIDFAPDVVISGINLGANLGTDIIFSGTVAGARQAALMKVPGIAVSLVTESKEPDFAPAARFIADTLPLLTSLWDEQHFINVNIPEVVRDGWEITVTRPSRRIYDFRLVERPSRGEVRIFGLKGAVSCAKGEGNTDWEAIRGGVISISPVNLYPINHSGNELRYTDSVATSEARKRSAGLK